MYENFSNILVSRKGDICESHMKTINIVGTICPNKFYEISKENLIETHNNENTKYLSHENILCDIEPINFKIHNISQKWNNEKKLIINNSNILGDNGILKLDVDHIDIPIAETTINNLSFYDCTLLKIGDVIQFDIESILPITVMNIGKNYAKHYLLNKNKGGGCYLEYHNTPHFHMPLNDKANGYIILGTNINDICHLSAFKIPHGFAIYTKPNVIHCDGFLVGDYLVVYTVTDKYSTVLLKNDTGIVDVNIKQL